MTSTVSDPSVRTDRLDLIPMGAPAIDALIAGDAGRLRELTNTSFPDPAAPPPYMAEALPVVREHLIREPGEAPWWTWIAARRGDRQVVGAVALGGPPDAEGAVLIGYAIYPQHEGKGYATEAVRGMVAWALRQSGVRAVRALAPVWNTPALRVAENVGMRPVASDEDDEVGQVLTYEIAR